MTDLPVLMDSWHLSLKADRKSPATIESYLLGVNLFLRWCADNNQTPELTRPAVRAWISALLDGGAQPTTARARQMALKRFSAWLYDEGELDTDELAGLKPPKLDTKVVVGLTDEQCVAIIEACAGKELIDRRDEAALRMLIETGLRASELLGMTLADLDLTRGLASVMGKGRKGRVVPFGSQTARAVDRYLRIRARHPRADSPLLWLGGGGQMLGYHGLNVALKRRANMAGIEGFHIHMCRNTAASRWLAAGGSEGGLMAVAGWSSREMLDRYVRSTAADRAAAEARNLNLGDW